MPRLLDLFCCAGGAAKGYHEAGFEIVGVDIAPQPRYPFAFIQADVLGLDQRFLRSFDAIHASPVCYGYSDLAKRNGNADSYPKQIPDVRALLKATDKLYVIENVEGAPLESPTVLCGTMFPGLRVLRHRLFETNWTLVAPPHGKHPLCYTLDKRKAHYGKLDEMTAFVMVNGGGNCTKAAAADAMGIDWMTKEELNEAIPPAYTRYIGERLIARLNGIDHNPLCSIHTGIQGQRCDWDCAKADPLSWKAA
jgi:DNA (cytosine-5)-methyltransferase 1